MKNPLTPAGLEPATFWFVAQHRAKNTSIKLPSCMKLAFHFISWGRCTIKQHSNWDCLSMVLGWTEHTKPNVRQMHCYCDRLHSGVWQRSVEERIETNDKGSRQQEFENSYTVRSFVTDTLHQMFVGRLTLWSTKLVYALCNKLGNVCMA